MNNETKELNINNNKSEKNKDEIICLWCNQKCEIIWVHGHGQCSNCGYNIDECCRGESICIKNQNDVDFLL
jgi:hypothetical protein